MVTNYIKKVAGLFAVLLLVSVVGISLPATNVNANEVKEVNICDYQIDPGDNGLIKDAVMHDKNDDSSFFKIASNATPFAENVVVDFDSSLNIRSQTDLENFYNFTDTFSEGFYVYAYVNNCDGGKGEIAAVWTVPVKSMRNIRINGDKADIIYQVDRFAYYTQTIKDKLGIQDYLNAKALQDKEKQTPSNNINANVAVVDTEEPIQSKVGDPDGNCSDYYVCFQHTDGGQTGFHGRLCYYGRWDGVYEIAHPNAVPATIYYVNGQLLKLPDNRTTGYSSLVSINTVNIS